jgi:hypothetical protein
VFPVKYELDSYILFRRMYTILSVSFSAFKGLIETLAKLQLVQGFLFFAVTVLINQCESETTGET